MPSGKIRLKPLKQWICDHCNRVIHRPEHGWISWLREPETGRSHGFIIVHNRGSSPLRPAAHCNPHARIIDGKRLAEHSDETYLTAFTDRGPIAYLLGFVDPSVYVLPDQLGSGVVDLQEWAKVFRRLTLPYYEEARFYLDQAAANGAFIDCFEAEIYEPGRLRDIIKKYGK